MATRDIILSAAAHNDQLLATLGETDYAPSALRQAIAYITELEAQVVIEEKRVAKAVLKLRKEQVEHEMYRDSRVRRLAYKMSGQKGKFDAKAEKEEREYHDALQGRVQAEKKLETLKDTLNEVQASKIEYEKTTARHNKAQVELDALYNSIFDGPTPEFPEEDAAEVPVRQAQQIYQDISAKLNIESQAVQLLSDADKKMLLCRRAMAEALSASEADIWGFGGPFADIAERDYLSQAQTHASNVEMLVNMARRSQPLIQPIGEMRIAAGSFVSDILFDNIFSDLAFHDKIKASEADVARAQYNLQNQLGRAKERLGRAKREAAAAEERLMGARKGLERVRMEAFARVARGGDLYALATGATLGGGAAGNLEDGGDPGDEPPPAYAPPAYER